MKPISIKMVGLTAVAALGLAGTTWAAMSSEPSSSNSNMSNQPQTQEPGSTSPEQTSPGSSSQTQAGSLTNGERNFLQSAAESNATEVELGRIAEQKSNDPNIKKIGQDLVRDHSAANQQLQRLASSKGVTITEQPTSSQQRMINSLSETSGDRFNKQFLRQARISHERALTLFERASRRAQDLDIKNWASQMVPAVQEHLAMIKGSRPEAVAEKGNPTNAEPQQHPAHQQHQMQPQGSSNY